MKLDKFTKQYLITALWSEIDDNDQPFDRNYNIEDISTESIEQAIIDCLEFQSNNGNLLENYDLETAAHDFWLTRHHHGAGFWDGDYKKDDGEKLTKSSQSFKEIYISVGDDGKLHFE